MTVQLYSSVVYSVQVYTIQVHSVQVYRVQVYSVQVYSVQVYSVQSLNVGADTNNCQYFTDFGRVNISSNLSWRTNQQVSK